MSAQTTRTFIRKSALVAVAAAGLVLSGVAQAQPYDDGYYGNPEAGTPYANGVTVIAPDRRDDINGTGEVITASRVVDISDLDLDTGWGVHVLHDRVKHAAVSACRELDDRVDAAPLQPGDGDCVHRAVRNALASVPVGVDADYTGY